MQPWWILSLRIGAFGFLKEYRPEDPYITQYLVGPVMNLTEDQVNQEVYPVATYVGLVQIIFVFLLTDFLCYKPIIVVNALSGVISQSILIWCRGLLAMQIMEFWYATMTACEVAYYTYIYAKVEREHYQKVTSHMRAAALTGRFTSACTSQLVLSFGLLSVAQLNHLTFVGMCCALVCALSLPSMDHSLYFHRKTRPSIEERNGVAEAEPSRESESPRRESSCFSLSKGSEVEPGINQDLIGTANRSKCRQAVGLLYTDFTAAYSNLYVVKMCIWVALGTCGFNQMMTYVQLLWVEIGGKQAVAYNGAVEATYTIISAAATLGVGHLGVNWSKYGEAFLGLLSVLQGVVLVLSAVTDSMLVAYVVYVVFGMLYNVMLVMANSEVAKHINEDSYALIFGVNTFVALILQTALTFAIAGDGGLALSIRSQFDVYGGYFLVLGGAYAIKSVFTICFRR